MAALYRGNPYTARASFFGGVYGGGGSVSPPVTPPTPTNGVTYMGTQVTYSGANVTYG